MIVTLLRKPLNGGILTVLPCAVLNIDSSRIEMSQEDTEFWSQKVFWKTKAICYGNGKVTDRSDYDFSKGRFPANLVCTLDVNLRFFALLNSSSRIP